MSNNFSGKTIRLGNDIDLNDKGWTPIGLYHDEDDTADFAKKGFSGTFDGQNHIISKLKIENDNGKSSYRALFGNVTDGTVKNFTVEGEIKACDSAGVIGALVGGTIENVTNKVNVSVKNATPQGANANEKPQAKVAGIVVAVKNGSASVIKDCKNEGTITSTAAGAQDAVGGIVAWQQSSDLTISGCTNSGTITAVSTQNAGGIVGTTATYAAAGVTTKTTITRCTNTGAVSGGKNNGGIVGCIWKGGTVTLTSNTYTGGSPNKEVGWNDNSTNP